MAMSQRMWRREQERRKRERERRARQRRNCMIIVIVAIAAVILIISKGCFGKKDSAVTEQPAPEQSETLEQEAQTKDVQRYESAIDITDVNTSFFSSAAFLGNSVADSIGMYNLLKEADFYTDITLDVDNVYTTATGYSTTAAIDQLKSKQFTRVFLSFGELEIASDDVKEFIKSYTNLIDKVKSYQAKAQIYVISIPPSTKETTSSGAYGMTLGKIKEYNRRIKAMAASEDVYYIDSVAALGKDGGYLPHGASADGINLNRGCCIDLLQYITKKAYIPDKNSLSDEDEDDVLDEEDNPKSTAAPKKRSSSESEPEPTVNVLKDSVKKSSEE